MSVFRFFFFFFFFPVFYHGLVSVLVFSVGCSNIVWGLRHWVSNILWVFLGPLYIKRKKKN